MTEMILQLHFLGFLLRRRGSASARGASSLRISTPRIAWKNMHAQYNTAVVTYGVAFGAIRSINAKIVVVDVDVVVLSSPLLLLLHFTNTVPGGAYLEF